MPASPAAEDQNDIVEVENDDVVLDSQDQTSAEDSSNSEDQDAKEPTVDRYKAAQDAIGEQSSDSESDQEKEDEPESVAPKEETDEEDELPDEISDDELKGYKPKTRRRMEQLLTRVKERDEQITALEAPAGEYQKIEAYLESTGTTYEQCADAVEVAALLNNDPEEAYKRLAPIMQELAQKVGAVLPQDLQQSVDSGYMTQEGAREIARLRARESVSQEQQQRQQEQQKRQYQQTQRQLMTDMQNAVAGWEQRTASSDPDYKHKSARVQEKIELALLKAQQSGTLPQSVNDAVAIAENALKVVNDEYRKIGKKPAVSVVDGGSSNTAKAPPRDKYEAAEQALAAG